MTPTTLVFPVSTPDGRAYLDAALRRREAVVGASCDAIDPIAGKAPWRRLPLVHAPDFLPELLRLVRDFGVTQIHASAHMVHAQLSDLRQARFERAHERPEIGVPARRIDALEISHERARRRPPRPANREHARIIWLRSCFLLDGECYRLPPVT